MLSCCGKRGEALKTAGADKGSSSEVTTLKGCDKFKDITLKVVGVISLLAAIFAFLSATGVLPAPLDASLMGGEVLSYTVGGAASVALAAIVARTFCCGADKKDAKAEGSGKSTGGQQQPPPSAGQTKEKEKVPENG